MELIYETLAGSHLYGIATEESDVDTRAVALEPMDTLLGLKDPWISQEQKNPDRVVYGLRKFVHLALECNPNILDDLFAPRTVWIHWTSDWEKIYAIRGEFLSDLVRKTFVGYAVSQLHRIERHRRWILNPPEEPRHERFGATFQGGRWVFPSADQQKAYRDARQNYDAYTTWRRDRNPKRAELEEKYGYDTKHAAHLMRLLFQAENILETGDYNPRLHGETLWFVKSARCGAYTYEYLMELALAQQRRVEEMPSVLPAEPNRTLVEEMLVRVEYYWVRRTLGDKFG